MLRPNCLLDRLPLIKLISVVEHKLSELAVEACSDVSMMVRRQLNYSLNRCNLQLFALHQEVHCVISSRFKLHLCKKWGGKFHSLNLSEVTNLKGICR